MLTATCHCGAVRVEIARRPRRVTNCNCSICRRYGTLWAYFKSSEVRVSAAHGAIVGYMWGDKSLRFARRVDMEVPRLTAPLPQRADAALDTSRFAAKRRKPKEAPWH